VKARAAAIAITVLIGCHAVADASDANIPVPAEALERQLATEPFSIVAAEISRPTFQGDITLKAEISFSGNPSVRVKLRRAEPGAENPNNRPRYELAAYELQKLFLESAEFVVPPTALRVMPVAELLPYAQGVRPTFRGSDGVLVVLQYWLHDVKVVADAYSPQLFATDAGYARHVGQLNVLTYLIEHGDANVGNFLVSRSGSSPRVFSVDNGIAFAFNRSDRGNTWSRLRVPTLPADTLDRLRSVSRDDLQQRLAVLAQWRLVDGRWVAEAPGENLDPRHGVRQQGGVVQLGLTKDEIARVDRRRIELLEYVDEGRIGLSEE